MSAEQTQAGAATAEAVGGRYPAALPDREAPEIAPEPARARADLEPRVLGGTILRFLERGFLYLDRLIGRVVPEPLNPFLHTGAVVVTSLLVATVTGVLLLFWYRPSVHLAWPSVSGMASQPWTAGLMRSLHRYSSDLAMLFALTHAARLFLERRFTGPRWLGWVTGVASVGATWFIGWTGYWLVWDTRAHAVAAGTARPLDVLPIFADPLGRSFLTDASLDSLLFFVVFFVHMLVPLAVGILLYLHLVRVARARFLTKVPLTIWTLGALLVLSAFLPADTAAPAHMTALRQSFTMDAWYLSPLYLTDRLGGGALWLILLAGGAVLGAIPWWLARRRMGVAKVAASRCNACAQCYADCPYNAIAMVPRTDGSAKHALQAEVDPGRCVGCGICAASCDSAGTDLDWFSTVTERLRLDAWVDRSLAAGEAPIVVFSCARAAGADLEVDAVTGRCADLPGTRVLQVPCAGWVHAFTVERVLRRGAARAVIVACGLGQCHYREGGEWLQQRLDGERKPALRMHGILRGRVQVLRLDRSRRRDLVRAVGALRAGAPTAPARPSRAFAGLAAALLAAIVAWGVGAVSQFGYASPRLPGSELIVTFEHPGQKSEHFRVLTPGEMAKLPVHMRSDRVYDRARAAVRMRVTVDDRLVVNRGYPPTGLWHDGNSIAVETIPVVPGEHAVEVTIGDTHLPDEWTYRARQRLAFTREARRVIAFDRLTGFTVH